VNEKDLQILFGIRCRTGKQPIQDVFLDFFLLNRLQLRSSWIPGFDTCNTANAERDKVAILIMFAIDVIVVLVMFVGLLRLRGQGGGMLELGRLLWKQVRWWQFLVPVAYLIT
jgi:hypothetical protein